MDTTTVPKTRASHLSEDQLREIEQRLDAREIELQARVREAKEEREERPSAQGPFVEDIGEEGEQRYRSGMEHIELLRDQEELTDIAAARERIAHGRYGECEDCGKDIAVERLNAQPTAIRCVICQGAYEKKHGTNLRYSQ